MQSVLEPALGSKAAAVDGPDGSRGLTAAGLDGGASSTPTAPMLLGRGVETARIRATPLASYRD